MTISSLFRFVFAVIVVAITACGGGGGSTTSASGGTIAPTPTDYSCDPVLTLASSPRTAPFTNTLEPSIGHYNQVTKVERWTLNIEGVDQQLNVAIAWPDAGIPIRGTVVMGHGQADVQATLPPTSMYDVYWNRKMGDAGYVVVWVARRGNYGSTGNMYASIPNQSASSQMKFFKYQAASLIAVMDKMSQDPVYKSHMNSIVLAGASGGSDTVIQASADSVVFQAATKKAIIRFDGGVGTGTAVTAEGRAAIVVGLDEYAATVEKSGVSSLWVVGDQDTFTNPGWVACQYLFYNKTAGYHNTFRVVPGMGHDSYIQVFSPALSQTFREYMVSRGFEGF